MSKKIKIFKVHRKYKDFTLNFYKREVIWLIWFGVIFLFLIVRAKNLIFLVFIMTFLAFLLQRLCKKIYFRLSVIFTYLMSLAFSFGISRIEPFGKGACYGDACDFTELHKFFYFTLDPLIKKFYWLDYSLSALESVTYLFVKILIMIVLYYFVLSFVIFFLAFKLYKFFTELKLKHLKATSIIFFLFFAPLATAITDHNISNNGLILEETVFDTGNFIVDFVPTDFDSISQGYLLATEASLQVIKKIYPLGDNSIDSSTGRVIFESEVSQADNMSEICDATMRLYVGRVIANLPTGRYIDRVVGLVPGNWFETRGNPNVTGVACAVVPDNNNKAVISEISFPIVPAHEIGHTYGLCDEYKNSTWNGQNERLKEKGFISGCPNGDLDNDGFLDFSCLNSSTGGCSTKTFDVIRFPSQSSPSEEVTVHNMMGKASSDWIDKPSYDHLLSQFLISQDFINVDSAIVVSGNMNKNESILFNEFYIINQSLIANVTKLSGNYTFSLKIGGQTFYSTKLNPEFSINFQGGETVETNVSYFAFVVPFNQSVTSIVLQNSSGAVLAERNVSSNTPVVSINSSINGQLFNDSFVVNWNASDLDGDNLTYSVLLSSDGGYNFTTLALDINTTNISIENSFLENGSQYIIKVLATDGVKTGVGINNASFSIEPDPFVELISPADDLSLIDNNVVFKYVVSSADNNISNCSLYINGFLNQTNTSVINQGEPMNFTKTLPLGDYNWTVKCVDALGLIGESEVRKVSIDFAFIEFLNVSAYPAQQAFGENVSLRANLNTSENVTVILNITNPLGSVASYTLINSSYNVWDKNFTAFINGTYNFTFFANYTNELSVRSGGSFEILVNLVGNCRTLNVSGLTYSLTKNINYFSNCIIIGANNIVFDGKGYTVSGNFTENTNGITVTNRENIWIKNITVGNFGVGISNANRPIKLSYINSIFNNGSGIHLQDTDSFGNIPNVLENVNSSFNSGFGIRFLRVSNTNLTNVFLSDNVLNGIEASANPSLFITPYYNLYNITIIGNDKNGLEFVQNINNTIIKNGLIVNNFDTDVYIKKSSNISFTNLNISSLKMNQSINNILLNVSILTEELISNSSLTRKWYYKAFASNATGNLSGVNVTAYNKSNSYQFNLITNTTGYTQMTEVIDYVNNGGNKTYYSPYTIYASHPNYNTISHERNITQLTNIYNDTFTFGADVLTACQTIENSNAVYTLGSNISTTSTCFVINGKNVTLDGAGHTITGDGHNGDHGVYANGTLNVSIKNLRVAQFDRAVYLDKGTNNSFVFNVTAFNNTYGVYIQRSNNNLVRENNVSNNTARGVVILNANDNKVENNIANGNPQYGLLVSTGSNNTLVNNTANYNQYGIYLFLDSDNNTISNNTFNYNTDYGGLFSLSDQNIIEKNIFNFNSDNGIFISGSKSNIFRNGEIRNSGQEAVLLNDASADENLFSNISISGTNSTYHDFRLKSGVDWTVLEDVSFGNYSFTNNTIILRNSIFGEIKFIQSITTNGTNLTRDVMITNNSVQVRSDLNIGLNKSANVTLYGIGERGFSNPRIFRDNTPCALGSCYNFTSLTATNVIFNVTGWTNYSIGSFVNDSNKFYIQNASGGKLGWFGSEGNIVLKGVCTNQTICDSAPANSFKIKNATGGTVAYVDSSGNMCIQGATSCQNSDQQISCSSPNPSIIITNSSNSEMVVIDRNTGSLCLTGSLVENSAP